MRRFYLFRHCEAPPKQSGQQLWAATPRGARLATTKRKNQSGGVLVWILVAIALFSALSYAMMDSSRSSVSMMTDTQAKLYATEIIAYGDSIRQAVQTLRIRGVPVGGLSFENDVFKKNNGDLLNPATAYANCMEDTCKIFHPKGGGITPRYVAPEGFTAPDPIPTYFKPGSPYPYAASLDGVGTAEKDVVIILGDVGKNVCLQLNDMLDVNNPNGNPPSVTYGVGSYVNYVHPVNFSAPGTTFTQGVIVNHRSYCYARDDQPNIYRYITTLIAR